MINNNKASIDLTNQQNRMYINLSINFIQKCSNFIMKIINIKVRESLRLL